MYKIDIDARPCIDRNNDGPRASDCFDCSAEQDIGLLRYGAWRYRVLFSKNEATIIEWGCWIRVLDTNLGRQISLTPMKEPQIEVIEAISSECCFN